MINEAVARVAMVLATGYPNRRSGAPMHPLRTAGLLLAETGLPTFCLPPALL